MQRTWMWLCVGSILVGGCLAFLHPPLLAQPPALRYEVDPSWPKPFPDRWVTGGLGGLCVDHDDHVLILNRQDVIDADLNGGHLAPPLRGEVAGRVRGSSPFIGRAASVG